MTNQFKSLPPSKNRLTTLVFPVKKTANSWSSGSDLVLACPKKYVLNPSCCWKNRHPHKLVGFLASESRISGPSFLLECWNGNPCLQRWFWIFIHTSVWFGEQNSAANHEISWHRNNSIVLKIPHVFVEKFHILDFLYIDYCKLDIDLF